MHEKGPDVNFLDMEGFTPLHFAQSLDVLKVLLDCGADPAVQNDEGSTPLMWQLSRGYYDSAARLLEDPRVRATVNVQDFKGDTALHELSVDGETPDESVVAQLLKAGADPTLENNHRERVLDWYEDDFLTHPTTLALLEQSLSAEKASFLVKVRRLVMAAHRTTAPSFLVGRVADGLPLPHVALASVTTNEQNAGEEEGEERQQAPHQPSLHVWGGAGGHAAGRVSGRAGPVDAIVGSA